MTEEISTEGSKLASKAEKFFPFVAHTLTETLLNRRIGFPLVRSKCVGKIRVISNRDSNAGAEWNGISPAMHITKEEASMMSDSFHRCCTPGCLTEVPSELEKDGLCVVHFLLSAERACSEMRRETTLDGSNPTRRAEFENYVAQSAVKLAMIGTGSVRLSDEIKKRVLTTFHTLMILRENLDRPANTFLPRRVNRAPVAVLSAVAHV